MVTKWPYFPFFKSRGWAVGKYQRRAGGWENQPLKLLIYNSYDLNGECYSSQHTGTPSSLLEKELIYTTPDLKVESASLWAWALKNDFGATNYSRTVERQRAMIPSKNSKSTTLHLRGLLNPTLQTDPPRKTYLWTTFTRMWVSAASQKNKERKKKKEKNPILWVLTSSFAWSLEGILCRIIVYKQIHLKFVSVD